MLWPFPDSHPSTHVLLHTPQLQGLDTHPCHQESQSALLGRAKGKFGIKIPKFGIKNSSVAFIFFPFLTQPEA